MSGFTEPVIKKIHVGIGLVYLGGVAPTAGNYNSITSGAPTSGGQYIGSTLSAATLTYNAKYLMIEIEQAYSAVDAALESEDASLEFEMGETSADLMKTVLGQVTETTNSGASPTNKLITAGGLNVVTPQVACMISPKRDGSGNYYITTLYKVIGAESFAMAMDKKKPSGYKIKLAALADITRPVGDQLFQQVEQGY